MCWRFACLTPTTLITCALLSVSLGGCRAKTAAPDPAEASQAAGVSGAVLDEVEAYTAPPGADQALLSELQDELARVLSQRLATEGGKITCVPPLGDVNRIADLAYVQPPSEPARLAWSYLSIGDYDQNGEVNVSDLTPLGANFGAVGPFGHENVLSVIDGDNNGELNIGDVTPIGQHFRVQVAAYNVYASLDAGDYPPADDAPNGAGAELLGTVPLASAVTPLAGRSLFSFEITAPVADHIYWVRPNDGTTDGSPSNQVTAPAPPEWAHTWGGGGIDIIEALAVDGDGNIYVTGSTTGFGVVGYDVLVLSFDPNGEVRWTSTWGGDFLEWGEGITVAGDTVYIAGATSSFSAGGDDALLLTYTTDGAYIEARTWGTAVADEWGRAVAVDSAGDVYVAGRLKPAGPGSSFALLKYTAAGPLDWQLVWGATTIHSLYAIEVDQDDGVIAAGSFESSAGNLDVAYGRLNPDGSLDWGGLWDSNSGGDEWGTAVAVGPAGNIYFAGATDGFSPTNTEMLLQQYDADGVLQWSRTWGYTGSAVAGAVDVDDNGDVYLAGYTQEGLTPDAVLLVKYDSSGALLWARRWTSTTGIIAASAMMVDGESVCLAGNAPNNTGAWEDITGVSTGVAGVDPAEAALVIPIMPAIGAPEGTEDSPVGVLDTGGGAEDALVIKRSAT